MLWFCPYFASYLEDIVEKHGITLIIVVKAMYKGEAEAMKYLKEILGKHCRYSNNNYRLCYTKNGVILGPHSHELEGKFCTMDRMNENKKLFFYGITFVTC